MQRLNLRSPKKFDFSDEAGTISKRARFYCISEGPTEESYFWGVRNNKKELGIKNDVYIEVISKQSGQESYSHPEQLIKACLYYMGRQDVNGNDIPEEKWSENIKWDYDPEIDCVCVIFDRDYRNLEDKLPELYKLCQKHKIYIALSNPNFELWLLMHFPNIDQYDKEILLRNPKNLNHSLYPEASKHKKYLEILLSKQAGGYSKGCKIRFEQFLELLPTALKQSKLFCEDPELLNRELGTSVGRLIEKMQGIVN